jgi:hypothetical protein
MPRWTRVGCLSALLLSAAMMVGDGIATPAEAQCNTMFVGGNRVTVCLNGGGRGNGAGWRPERPGGHFVPGTGGGRWGRHTQRHVHYYDRCVDVGLDGPVCSAVFGQHYGSHRGPYGGIVGGVRRNGNVFMGF